MLRPADPVRPFPREKSISVWLFHHAAVSDPAAAFVHSPGRIILRSYVHPSGRCISRQKSDFTNFTAQTPLIFVTLHNVLPSNLYRLTCIPVLCFSALVLHSVLPPPSNRLTSGLLALPPGHASPAVPGAQKRSLPLGSPSSYPLLRILRTAHESVKLIAKYTRNANPNSTNTSVTWMVPRLKRSTQVPL